MTKNNMFRLKVIMNAQREAVKNKDGTFEELLNAIIELSFLEEDVLIETSNLLEEDTLLLCELVDKLERNFKTYARLAKEKVNHETKFHYDKALKYFGAYNLYIF